jgi:hypothetical protein
MKLCKYCQVERPEEMFEICRVLGAKVYRRLRCQKCKRRLANERRGRLRKWLDNYKQTLSCERCGFRDFRALQFHHRDQSLKEFNVADMTGSGLSEESIRREIEKCSVLCANCHHIETYRRDQASRPHGRYAGNPVEV